MRTNQKAQVLVIFLWILIALAIFTVSLSDRVSMALKFTQTRKDILKAGYLSYAGLNIAIVELKNDAPVYNDLADIRTKVTDEEAKININYGSPELLLALMEYYNISPAQEIVNNLLAWRGDIPDIEKIYEGLGYPCKAKPFANTAELMLIKGIDEEAFKKISPAVTVYGEGGININTASAETIKILCRSLAKQQEYGEACADRVADAFIALRDNKPAFNDKSGIEISFTDSEATNIFNALIEAGEIASNNFMVEVSGNTGKITTRVSVVYNRAENRIESWYEG